MKASILPQRVCRIKRGVIDFPRQAYYIPLDKCSTYAEIVAWCLQLLEKSWTEKPHLEQFILLACEHHKLNPMPAI